MTYHSIVTNICPVCGYHDSLGEVFGTNGENAYQEICPSCGTQFGYTDCFVSHRVLRKRWAKEGFTWHSKLMEYETKNREPLKQLKNLQLEDEEINDLIRLSDPSRLNEWEFTSFRNLEEAKKNKNIYLIMEGDYGRKIYLSIPVELVKCDEKEINKLLKRIDKICCNNIEGATYHFEGVKTGCVISAEIDKGIADSKLWVHRKLENFKDEFSNILTKK